MSSEEQYIEMQRSHYEDQSRSVEDVVGYYDWHELFPYETFLLNLRADVRKPLFSDTSDLVALDFGCGPGRMVKRMNKLFKRCDGVDISQRLVEEARRQCPESQFWVTNGNDLGDAPSSAYDFVFSTIAMQHIAVHSIRMQILQH